MSWSTEEASVQVDSYLDELLASRSRRVPARDEAAAELAQAAAVVREALVRFHPSFRFEEELAARLRAVAGGAAQAARAAGAATVVCFPTPVGMTLAPAGAAPAGEASSEPAADGGPQPSTQERGWMLVGGAIASGVSLAAGVLLARRRARHDGDWERLA
jgi:hypothetical protein